ncbi:MAG: hypothetical protein JWL90_1477 [Chthoniobacteraceae bacterium]|nr:hypothetical protein [Chthoniobacteraceae bacterium]
MDAIIAESFEFRINPRPVLVAGRVLILTWLADFLFWGAVPGVSIGLFGGIIGALLLGERLEARRASFGVMIRAALLLLACVQSAIEVSFTNITVIVVLLLILAGDTFYPGLGGTWSRVSEAAWSLVCAPFRWMSLFRAVAASPVTTSASGMVTSAIVGRLLRIVLPAAVLAGVFAVVLSYGNAVLDFAFVRVFTRLSDWLLHIDFSLGRGVCWLAFGTLALGIFWPARARQAIRWWTKEVPRWQRRDRVEALWQSGLILALLNVLFFGVNTIDVLYLWQHGALPSDVSFSRYVHEGVYGLVGAVLLSAALLTVLFQQNEELTRSRWLKGLALLWIAQNLILIAGVLLRLKLYVDAYQLSELRVYVGAFLLLITCGFILLGWHVARGTRLAALLLGNGRAAFCLFFVLQFLDVAGWVANYNVQRWELQPSRSLDLHYLAQLGPGAWPALQKVTKNPRDPALSGAASVIMETIIEEQRTRLARFDWRTWQARRDNAAQAIVLVPR